MIAQEVNMCNVGAGEERLDPNAGASWAAATTAFARHVICHSWRGSGQFRAGIVFARHAGVLHKASARGIGLPVFFQCSQMSAHSGG